MRAIKSFLRFSYFWVLVATSMDESSLTCYPRPLPVHVSKHPEQLSVTCIYLSVLADQHTRVFLDQKGIVVHDHVWQQWGGYRVFIEAVHNQIAQIISLDQLERVHPSGRRPYVYFVP